jgi:hypothetical protein
MQNQTFLTIIDIFGELSWAATYLGAAFVTFLILRHDMVKEWIGNSPRIIVVVIFLITTQLLYSAGMVFINLFINLPRRFILGDSLVASVRCLSGLLALAGLIAGVVLLIKNKDKF